jgi:chaperonin GroES
MNMKPLFDNIVVKPAKAEEQTKSGNWDKKGEHRLPMDVKVGDVVIYKEWGKTPIKIDGVEYFLMSQSDVLALVAE